MTTAIALAADYTNLLQLLESSDELTPEMITDTLEGIEGELADKLDAIMVIARNNWICPYISRHLLSLNPLLACCRRYSRGERYPSALCGCHSL